MNTKNKPRVVGAHAPQKERIFSINADRQEARIRLISNAPIQELQTRREIRRVRGD